MEVKERDEFYRGDLNDVTHLIRLLNQNYPSAFIHMVGFSRGGLQKDYLLLMICL